MISENDEVIGNYDQDLQPNNSLNAFQNKSYIQRKLVTVERLVCRHPQVDRIWEYGGMAATPTDGLMHRVVCLVLKNKQEVHKFIDDGRGEAIEEAEKFLQSLT